MFSSQSARRRTAESARQLNIELRLALICATEEECNSILPMLKSAAPMMKTASFSEVETALNAFDFVHYDIVLFVPSASNPSALNKLSQVKLKPDYSAVIVLARNLTKQEMAEAINDNRIDWVIDQELTPKELQSALNEARNLVDAHAAVRGARFSDDLITNYGKPTAILDREYRVIHANEAAKNLFDLRDPLQVSAIGQLVCDDVSATRHMHDAIRTSLVRQVKRNRAVFIRVPGKSDIGAIVIASQPVDAVLTNRYTYHLVFNIAKYRLHAEAKDYVDALAVTASEAHLVAALVEGCNVRAAAESLNITEGTARSYLKSIFNKVGVSRQSELVRLALLLTQ